MNLRNDLLKASKKRFEAQVEKHRVNVENMLNNSVGVGEHPDIMDSIEAELEKMSGYHDKLEMLDYFDVSLNDKKLLND
jgi:tetrahydrodipicolinate N-succinyltransferase|tara:strand:- start:711 stop:947 length:237 start_codon:yes stop_codon:yes gene_type:complete